MKLATLLRVFDQRASVKLYVLTEELCLCGLARNPRPTASGLRVTFGASVRFVLASRSILEEPERTGTLYLREEHKVTRRLQTHRRHLREHDVPERYFERALALGIE